MRWRIYYGDGSTFSNQDGPPDQAPSRNVQLIVVWNLEVGRILLHGFHALNVADFYWYRAEQELWHAGDYAGLIDYLMDPGPKTVKFGRNLPREDFFKLYAAALADPDFPAKSGVIPGEPRPPSGCWQGVR